MFQIHSFGSSSNGNCYLVSNGKTHILLECGMPYAKITREIYKNSKLKLNDLSACFVSHVHDDHCKSASEIAKVMPVFSTQGTVDKRKRVDLVKPFEIVKVNEIKIRAIPVIHGKTECYGFEIWDTEDSDNQLLFLTDLTLLEYNLINPFRQVMIECNFYEPCLKTGAKKEDRQINTHLDLKGTITHLEALNLTKCKEIYLMHLSDRYSDGIIMKATVEQRFGIRTRICKRDGGIL